MALIRTPTPGLQRWCRTRTDNHGRRGVQLSLVWMLSYGIQSAVSSDLTKLTCQTLDRLQTWPGATVWYLPVPAWRATQGCGKGRLCPVHAFQWSPRRSHGPASGHAHHTPPPPLRGDPRAPPEPPQGAHTKFLEFENPGCSLAFRSHATSSRVLICSALGMTR